MLSVVLQTSDFSGLTKPNTWEEKRLLEHTACYATGLGAEYVHVPSKWRFAAHSQEHRLWDYREPS